MATLLSLARSLAPLAAQFTAGLLVANATEWVMHKYVLHGLGRDRQSFWAFHWHDHHRHARRNGHIDPQYTRPLFGPDAHDNTSKAKEAGALVAAGLLTSPIAFVAPVFYSAIVYSSFNYYRVHRRSHIDPAWARTHLPWHYDHHMGPNQHANWCVTRPWFDMLMGTREPYLGTERAARDDARRAAAKSARAAGANDATPETEPRSHMPQEAPAGAA